MKYSLVCSTLAVASGVGLAHAQVITGDILGTVTDSSGAVVPNAKITLTNDGTQAIRTFTTGNNGQYNFDLLPTGRYTVTVEVASFALSKRTDIVVASGDRIRVDVPLALGGSAETVEVIAASPVLQTDSSTVGSTITQEQLQELPVSGRNVTNLITLQAGITPGNANSISGGSRPDERRQSTSYSANGQPESLNSNYLNGLDNNERYYGLVAIRPSLEGISDLRVDTNTFSAEVGRSAGVVVNIATRSGDNRFHGSVYEYFSNDIFSANDYFLKQSGSRRPEYRLNQYGGSIGGPIIKNKTFFFGDFEQYRLVQGVASSLQTVPTLFEEQNPGNFSDQGGPVLTAAQIDPVAAKVFALYPHPNVVGNANGNFISSPSQTQYATTSDARVDHKLGEHDQLFARYSYNPVSSFFPAFFPSVNGISGVGAGFIANGLFPGTNDTKAQGGQLNYTHIFSPTTLLELRTGFTRLNIFSKPYNYGTNASKALGIPNANIDANSSGLTAFHIIGYADLGDQIALPIHNINNTFQWNANLIMTKGSHDLHMGAALIRRQLNYLQEFEPEGWLWFFPSASGSSLVSLLKGTPGLVFRQNQPTFQYLRSFEPSIYFQDNWHPAPWLTVNLGARYDIYTPFSEAHDQLSNFQLNTLTLNVAGNGNHTAGILTDYSNLAPRIGFSAQVRPGLVLRGGFGFSYYPGNYATAINDFNPPFQASITCVPGNPYVPCPNGSGTVSAGPPLPVSSSATALAGNLVADQTNRHSSYVEQFNLFTQKQLGLNVITIGYVGVLGRHQPSGGYNADLPDPSTTASPALRYSAKLPNVTGIMVFENEYTSSYHGLEMSFERRFNKGLAFNANYTLSHGLNNWSGFTTGGASGLLPFNKDYDYGNSDLDVRNRVAGTLSYVLPYGKQLNGYKAVAAKGWEFDTTGFYQTGNPLSVINSVPQINLPGISADRPNVVPGQPLTTPGLTPTSYINKKAFALQTFGTAGNERNNQLYGPGTRQLDASIIKNFPIHDAFKAQFRAEGFNVLNVENFAQPVNDIAQPQFGAIIKTRTGLNPRQIQFAVKLNF